MYVTSEMAVAGKASYKDGGAARKHKRPPSVRSTAQKVSINSMSNIAPDDPEWRPSAQATRSRALVQTTVLATPEGAAKAEAEGPQGATSAWRPSSAARAAGGARPVRGVQWKAAAKPRPMSAGDITRLKRSYLERQADIAAVAALQ